MRIWLALWVLYDVSQKQVLTPRKDAYMPSAQHIFSSGQLFELSAKNTQTNHFDSFREALGKEANPI